jgi:hypothetical protein
LFFGWSSGVCRVFFKFWEMFWWFPFFFSSIPGRVISPVHGLCTQYSWYWH